MNKVFGRKYQQQISTGVANFFGQSTKNTRNLDLYNVSMPRANGGGAAKDPTLVAAQPWAPALKYKCQAKCLLLPHTDTLACMLGVASPWSIFSYYLGITSIQQILV